MLACNCLVSSAKGRSSVELIFEDQHMSGIKDYYFFNCYFFQIDKEIMAEKKWGQKGGPWEFNLRDLFRWCQLMLVDQSPGCYDPGQHVFLVYGERMRTREDKEKVTHVFSFHVLQIVRKYF